MQTVFHGGPGAVLQGDLHRILFAVVEGRCLVCPRAELRHCRRSCGARPRGMQSGAHCRAYLPFSPFA